MKSCEKHNPAGRHCDGELSGANAKDFIQHLPNCAECAGELENVRRVSRAFEQYRSASLSPEALKRIHAAVREENQGFGSILRIFELAAAVAAVVTITCGAFFYNGTAHTETAIGPLEMSAYATSEKFWNKDKEEPDYMALVINTHQGVDANDN